jgi:NitT/TauT family transport system substrate-binding protein
MLNLRKNTLIAAGLSALVSLGAQAESKTEFDVCWTIYAGWMPWDYAESSGIMAKWADKYGIKVNLVQLNDYVESINQYTAGQFDACAITNMDTLTIPAASGVDSTALIVGDYSNGNDGLVIKGKGKTLADIKGQPINLVELSVSHYFLARALETAGLSERDVRVINTSDADIAAAFKTPQVLATATWNPMLADVLADPNATQVFDSSQIPGEILDMMVANTQTLADNPALGKALTGAWFEVMGLMNSGTAQGEAALKQMAAASGTDLAGYKAQLATTKLFYTPSEALAFVTSPELPTTMQRVASFSFDHGLLGEGAPDATAIGMSFPNDKTWGDSANLKLRFNPDYVRMAAEGTL